MRLLRAIALLLLTACSAEPGDHVLHDTPFGGGGKADGEGGLRYRDLDVVFTNPLCGPHAYPAPVERAGGGALLTARPPTYCKSALDAVPSGSRPGTPQTRLREWIDATPTGGHIFLASLSYSDKVIGDALCRAVRDRGVEVTFVLDAASTRSRELEECGGTVLLRGHQGSIGFAHVKLVMIDPDGDGEFVQMAFGSGNMSAGTHLHHENWVFGEVARDSYFVQSHLCLRRALLDEPSTAGKGQFTTALATCRAAIPHAPETDARAYFIPALEDRKAAKKVLVDGVAGAATVDLAAHRFSYSTLITALTNRLSSAAVRVRLVADDDMYWLAPLVGDPREVGANDPVEAARIAQLENTGGDFEVRYVETNDGEHLLHHNKYVIFSGFPGGSPDAVIMGAPNFTGTAYEDNLENQYWFSIPHVVEAYREQYTRVWDTMATHPADMPAIYPAGP